MLRSIPAIALVILSAVGFPDGDENNRTPVPAKAEIDAATQKVRQIFRAEFAKTKATDRTGLARRLLELVADNKNDAAARYALLKEAKELASKGGDAALFLGTTRRMTAEFRVSMREACGNDTPATALTGLAVSREQVQALLDLIDLAIDDGDFARAAAFATGVESIARKSALPEMAAGAQMRTKSLPGLRKDFADLEAARRTLETKPADSMANRIVGRFDCFVRQRWDEGIARLLLGDDPALRDAVKKEVEAASGGASNQAAAAESWQKAAMGFDPLLKARVEARALCWLEKAAPNLTGLDKVLVDTRIKELVKYLAGLDIAIVERPTLVERSTREPTKSGGATLPEAPAILRQRLAGTKWVNASKATFEWTKDGRFLHRGIEKTWKVVGASRVEFGNQPELLDNTLLFNDSLTEFTQHWKGGTSKGHRSGGSK